MKYLAAFLFGALWTSLLTLEKSFIARHKAVWSGVLAFLIALFFVGIFRHYAHEQDPLELLAYGAGCGVSTFVVVLAIQTMTQKK